MRFWLFTFAIICSFLSIAQDIETDSIAPEDTTAADKIMHLPPISVHVEGQMIYAPTPGGYDFSRQLGAGINYKRFGLGLFYNLFVGQFSHTVIFPNEFDLLNAHGGGYLGYLLLDTRYLETSFRMNYGKGDMVWEYSETREDFLRDKVQILKPEIVVHFIPIKFVKVIAAAGYISYFDLNLPAISREDFSGLSLGLGLQIGYFHK